jgi:ferric-dicitrate binding protein FerR (iron transport regulator)
MVESEDQAARWFAAARRGLMTQDERIAYDAWRREPGHAAALADLQRIWLMLGPGDADLSVAAGTVGTRSKGRAASLPRPARVAAVLSAASIAAVALTRLDGAWWTTLDWWSR